MFRMFAFKHRRAHTLHLLDASTKLFPMSSPRATDPFGISTEIRALDAAVARVIPEYKPPPDKLLKTRQLPVGPAATKVGVLSKALTHVKIVGCDVVATARARFEHLGLLHCTYEIGHHHAQASHRFIHQHSRVHFHLSV